MNHAVWCSLHQRPGLQDFLQRLISGHSTRGVADIASCSLSADPSLAAQSVGAIDTDNFDPANKSSKLVSRGLKSIPTSQWFSSNLALHLLPIAPCSAWNFANGGVSKYIDSGAQHWRATGSSPSAVQHRATVAKTR